MMLTDNRSKFYSRISMLWEKLSYLVSLNIIKKIYRYRYSEVYCRNIRYDTNLYRVTVAGRVLIYIFNNVFLLLIIINSAAK